jgi:phosphoribosylformimino-5-aminoimidazole carboxamide ribonucleotide (ProFAR) isomerase
MCNEPIFLNKHRAKKKLHTAINKYGANDGCNRENVTKVNNGAMQTMQQNGGKRNTANNNRPKEITFLFRGALVHQ